MINKKTGNVILQVELSLEFREDDDIESTQKLDKMGSVEANKSSNAT